MALEDLTGSDKFIVDLVPANPAGGDDRREGDNHIRGVKNVLVNSFPNVDAPVTLTAAQFNELINAVIEQTDATLKSLYIGAGVHADPPLLYAQAPGAFGLRLGPIATPIYATFTAAGVLECRGLSISGSGTFTNDLTCVSLYATNGTFQGGTTVVGAVVARSGFDCGTPNDGAEKTYRFAGNGGEPGPYLYHSANGDAVGCYWGASVGGGGAWAYTRSTGAFTTQGAGGMRATKFTATPYP